MIRAENMVPSVGTYLRSFYSPSTYLPPVDLEQSLQAHRYPLPEVVQRAQQVASLPGVQSVLSEPLSFQPDEIQRKNRVLTDRQFQILARKPILRAGLPPELIPFYSVSEHPDLPGWIVKAAGYRVPQDQVLIGLQNDHNEIGRFTKFDSLLRLTMNQRIRQVAQEEKIDVVVPEEYAVAYSHPEPGDVSREYFVISKKINLTSEAETIARIAAMGREEQIALAAKVSRLVQKIGFADASFDNMRFTVDGKLALIDTEPAGLLTATIDPLYTKGHSVEKCARLGLFTLKVVADRAGLKTFSEEVDRHYQRSLKEISITRIVLSILCPLIPVVLLVIAVVNQIRALKMAQQILNRDADFNTTHGLDALMRPQVFQEESRKHQAATKPLRERYFSAIEGIPFQSVVRGMQFA